FVACFFLGPLLGGLANIFGVYTTVPERRARVYTLFGNVVGILDEPGLHFLWAELGWRALVINWLGRSFTLDLRLRPGYPRRPPPADGGRIAERPGGEHRRGAGGGGAPCGRGRPPARGGLTPQRPPPRAERGAPGREPRAPDPGQKGGWGSGGNPATP